jgi:hypothetical protein
VSARILIPPRFGITCVSASERYCATVVARSVAASTWSSRYGNHTSRMYSPRETLVGATYSSRPSLPKISVSPFSASRFVGKLCHRC